MSAHTPGPWHWYGRADDDSASGLRAHDGQSVLVGVWCNDSTADVGWFKSDDADLIAAAPDLLASLKEFVSLYDGLHDAIGPSVKAKLARAVATIEKAEGGGQ